MPQTWTMQSRRGRQTALAVGSLAVGLVLMVGGTQTVVVDPILRRIVVEDKRTLGGTKRREIGFGEVTGVSIGYLGKKSNFVQTYYLVLRLANGQEYPLFAPGRFFPGASDRSTVESWRRRLQGYMTT